MNKYFLNDYEVDQAYYQYQVDNISQEELTIEQFLSNEGLCHFAYFEPELLVTEFSL